MEQRFCTQCGARLKPGASFCTQCGSAVNDASEPDETEAATASDTGFDAPATAQPGATTHVEEPRRSATPTRKAPSQLTMTILVFAVAAVIIAVAAFAAPGSQSSDSDEASDANAVSTSTTASAGDASESSVSQSSSSEDDAASSSTSSKSSSSKGSSSTKKKSSGTTTETIRVTTTDGESLSGKITLHNGYVLPQSNKRLLTDDEIEDLNPAEMCIAMNELLARHGRHFLTPAIRKHFNSCDWYEDLGWTEERALPHLEQRNYAKMDAFVQEHTEYAKWFDLRTS